jgi:hypothetical protein
MGDIGKLTRPSPRRPSLSATHEDIAEGMTTTPIPLESIQENDAEGHRSFRGANEELEIEDYAEFLAKIQGKDVAKLSSYGNWVFQEVNFSAESEASWNRYNFDGCWFWGCTLPPHETMEALRRKGAHVSENPNDLPFRPFRAFMYTSDELVQADASIYKFYLTKSDLRSTMFQAAHDYSMTDALKDYVEDKAVIAFMGVHAMERHSPEFRQVVWLAWRLSRAGYVVATGGGPGAMAAANLGALTSRSAMLQMSKRHWA